MDWYTLMIPTILHTYLAFTHYPKLIIFVSVIQKAMNQIPKSAQAIAASSAFVAKMCVCVRS